MNYNLIEENWIPVLWNDGRTSRVGIKEVFKEAGNIRQIAASNPMDRYAILRFLIALLYWCKGNPSTDDFNDLNEPFPEIWFKKLEDQKSCFDLFAETKRFYQFLAPSEKKPERLTVNYLIQEVPTKTNFNHFRHATDKQDGLCPACCAIGLLRLPIFSTSGGKGKSPGINYKPPIYQVLLGHTLATSIRLSWLPVKSIGLPFWEKPDFTLPEGEEIPLLTGMTWLPRQVWLDEPSKNEKQCILCGRQERLVKQTIFAGLGSTKDKDESKVRMWIDPHVIYNTEKNGKQISLHSKDTIGLFDAGAGQWLDVLFGQLYLDGNLLPAIKEAIQKRINSGMQIKTWAIGFSTVQNDKYLEAIEYLLPIPNRGNASIPGIDQAKQWQDEGKKIDKTIKKRTAWGEDESFKKRKNSELKPAVAAIRPHVEHRVSSAAEKLLAGDSETWEQAAEEYRPMLEVVAQALSPGYTVKALRRRQRIANAIPNMHQTKTKKKDENKQKGGGNECD